MDTWIEPHATSIAGPDVVHVTRRKTPPPRAAETLPAMLAGVLEQLPHAAMIVTTDGFVLHASTRAAACLRRCGAWIDDRRRLVTLRPTDAQALNRALGAAGGRRRSLVLLGAGERRTAVSVQPLPEPGVTGHPIRALLMFGKSTVCDATASGAFGRAHGLTPAELMVLDALREGLHAKEVGARLNSSIATVRSHLRSIYNKTGSRDLRDLIAQLALLPPLE